MTTMTNHYQPCMCPHCGYESNMHTNTTGEVRAPLDGDVSLCIHCGNFSIYEGKILRHPNEQENQAIGVDEDCTNARKTWQMMDNWRKNQGKV